MFSDELVANGATRLSGNKLTLKDVNKLEGIFRTYLRGKISDYPTLRADLIALEDSASSDNAAQMATGLLIFMDSDLVEELVANNFGSNNMAFSERKYLFKVFKYMFSLFYPIPDGLTEEDLPTVTVPVSSGGRWTRTL